MSRTFLKQTKGLAAFGTSDMPQRAAFVVCFALLATGCALASLVFACAAPFAAFAVIAATMLPMASALAVMVAVWLINQTIGFGLLNYPADANTIAWGAVILAAALAGALAACLILRSARGSRLIALAIAFVAAFAAYELLLLAATPVLGGHEAMAPGIVIRIAGLNAIWLAGLLIAQRILSLLMPAGIQDKALFRT